MSLIVPDEREVEILTTFLVAMTLRLYSNDKTPSSGDVTANYTEVTGGGYVNKALIPANWGIVGGAPTVALYNTVQAWAFTGPTGAPGNIYGYYITRDSDNKLMWAERFPVGSAPLVPENGSSVRITPRLTCESA